MWIAKFFTASVVFSATLAAQSLTGQWDCTVTVNGTEIPFRMELSANSPAVKGNFFNGEERVPSTGGQLKDGSLRLNFDQYANRLEATVSEGGLEGRYGRDGRWYTFRAHRASPSPAITADNTPNIDGALGDPHEEFEGRVRLAASWPKSFPRPKI